MLNLYSQHLKTHTKIVYYALKNSQNIKANLLNVVRWNSFKAGGTSDLETKQHEIKDEILKKVEEAASWSVMPSATYIPKSNNDLLKKIKKKYPNQVEEEDLIKSKALLKYSSVY